MLKDAKKAKYAKENPDEEEEAAVEDEQEQFF
jgi:hypothetical protein